jgi:6-phosphogluconolactonase/glucosamine-6-phosphate isomerase/deaminase
MTYETTNKQTVIEAMALRLNQALESGSVLWLISGGSNIELEVAIRRELSIKNQLTVALIDERHGEVGHTDSNWQQLIEAGFDTNELSAEPTLTGLPIDKEAERYEHWLQVALQSHDLVIGLFGMGADGHTAGILPQSHAVASEDIVAFYSGHDFERITITPVAVSQVDEAYLVAFGDQKHDQLIQLVHHRLDIAHQPAQTLKLAQQCHIYTDQVLQVGF